MKQNITSMSDKEKWDFYNYIVEQMPDDEKLKKEYEIVNYGNKELINTYIDIYDMLEDHTMEFIKIYPSKQKVFIGTKSIPLHLYRRERNYRFVLMTKTIYKFVLENDNWSGILDVGN